MKNTVHEEFDEKGNLISAMFLQAEKIKTSYGELVPAFEADFSVRKKYRNAIEYYENGNIKSIYLHKITKISTLAGTFDAELITFYPEGNIKRIFPLYGQISAYWSEKDEFNLSREEEILVGQKKIKCYPRCIYFYPSGKVKSITIWADSELTFNTRYGKVRTNIGASFYEDGHLESIEPTADTVINVEGEKIHPFYPWGNHIHADNNSMKFDENGVVWVIKNVNYKFAKYA